MPVCDRIILIRPERLPNNVHDLLRRARGRIHDKIVVSIIAVIHAVQLPEPRLLDPATLYKLVPRLLDRAVTLLGIARIRHDALSGNGRINSQEYLEGILGKMPCHA